MIKINVSRETLRDKWKSERANRIENNQEMKIIKKRKDRTNIKREGESGWQLKKVWAVDLIC